MIYVMCSIKTHININSVTYKVSVPYSWYNNNKVKPTVNLKYYKNTFVFRYKTILYILSYTCLFCVYVT